jgi:hypothetical protein
MQEQKESKKKKAEEDRRAGEEMRQIAVQGLASTYIILLSLYCTHMYTLVAQFFTYRVKNQVWALKTCLTR